VYIKPASRYPVREDAERKPSPTFAYAYRKAQCARLLEAAYVRGDFRVTMIRPAWTCSEGGSILRAFGWNTFFLDRLRKGQPIIVPGDGTSFWVGWRPRRRNGASRISTITTFSGSKDEYD
jgi:nucleoside-diphosphate-sugar epimerase